MVNLINLNEIKEEFRIKINSPKFSKLNIRASKLEDTNLIKKRVYFEGGINNQNLENITNKKPNKVENLNIFSKSDYLGDLTRLISCSQNYYEDLIKIFIDEEKVIELNKSMDLEINGSGILYILINEDIKLCLNLLNNIVKKSSGNINEDSFIFIKINVKKGKKLELIDISNNLNLFKNLVIFLEEDSTLKTSQFVFNSRINLNKVILKKNSEYSLRSVYKIDNSKLYLENQSIHNFENNKTNMEISGVCLNNSFVINDGKIIIEQRALDSIAHQKLNNIILDSGGRIMSDPILEVKNSKVECSHGSSISNIDEEILFYLNSKGIKEELAKELILLGLIENVII